MIAYIHADRFFLKERSNQPKKVRVDAVFLKMTKEVSPPDTIKSIFDVQGNETSLPALSFNSAMYSTTFSSASTVHNSLRN